jgi:NAD(P)-dependent dehydrogenase (short-subunit alcohol dehydrogenase family)
VELARRGNGVILTYNGNATGAKEAVAAIEEAGGTAVALPLDLGDSTSFAAFADRVGETAGSVFGTDRITALVNNGGIGGGSPFPDVTEEHFDLLNRVMFKGTYFLTQRLLPLLADGGAIVNVASSSATTIERGGGYTAYAAVKGAIITFSQYLAVELAERRIRVNALAPGATRTNLGDGAFDKHAHLIPALAEKTLLGRIGEPEDIALVVAVLAGEEGRWITGQVIEATGGYQFGI